MQVVTRQRLWMECSPSLTAHHHITTSPHHHITTSHLGPAGALGSDRLSTPLVSAAGSRIQLPDGTKRHLALVESSSGHWGEHHGRTLGHKENCNKKGSCHMSTDSCLRQVRECLDHSSNPEAHCLKSTVPWDACASQYGGSLDTIMSQRQALIRGKTASLSRVPPAFKQAKTPDQGGHMDYAQQDACCSHDMIVPSSSANGSVDWRTRGSKRSTPDIGCVMDHGQEVNSQACVWKGRRLFLQLSIRTTNGRFLRPLQGELDRMPL